MTWLPTKEVALLCNISMSAIQKAVKQGRYEHCYVNGKGRGGRQLRIALESLSSDAQARYRGEQEQEAADVRLSLTGAQREKLEAEGHMIVARGRTSLRYYVKDYEKRLWEISC